MIAPLAKFIDWYSLQIASALWLQSSRKWDRTDSKLKEAVEFANGPNFISAESEAAELEFKAGVHFRFHSPHPCEFAENNAVHGRLYRRAKDWQKYPTIILLHGGTDFFGYRYGFPLLVPVIHRAGFNAVKMVRCQSVSSLSARGSGGGIDFLSIREALEQMRVLAMG